LTVRIKRSIRCHNLLFFEITLCLHGQNLRSELNRDD
jgi:hypothetical protein